MKLGDILLNEFASPDNPYRIIMYLYSDGTYICCVTSNGTFIKFHKQTQRKDNFLKVVKSIDIPKLLIEISEHI